MTTEPRTRYGIGPFSRTDMVEAERRGFAAGRAAALGEEMEQRLAALYPKNRLGVALVCDEALDRSGALLGRVRNLAYLAAHPVEAEERDRE